MSDDERALVTAIQASPDENTARLAYADWLDENGTTDQQRARAEWIRMTCNDRSKRAQAPTGRQIRMAGEPAWVRANANRLWPSLMGFEPTGVQMKTHLTFHTGQIEFTLPLEVPIPRQAGATRIDPSNVMLTAERGVATVAVVSFLRTALVAPAVARDEPAVAIRFFDVPSRCFEIGPGRIAILLRPFALRDLAGVWDAIELEHNGDAAAPAKVLTFEGDRPPYRSTIEPLINTALTKWARECAVEE